MPENVTFINGGIVPGDFEEVTNWIDTDTSLPLLALPVAGDQGTINDNPTTGNVACDLIAIATGITLAGGVVETGAAVNLAGDGTQSSGGITAEDNTAGNTWFFSNMSIDSDPGCSVSGSSGVNYNCSIFNNITDDGTGFYAPISFSGDSITSPAMVNDSAATFSCSLFCPNINMPSMTCPNFIIQDGAGGNPISLVVGPSQPGNSVTWGNVSVIAAINCVASAALDGAGNITIVLNNAGGTVTAIAVSGALPSPADVRFGVAVGSTTGTCNVPPADHVLTPTPVDATTGTLTLSDAGHTLTSNGAYGIGGNSETPTATYPAGAYVDSSLPPYGINGNSITPTATQANPANVLNTNGAYGIGGNASTPTWQRPANVASDALAAPHIKSGDAFGISGASTGTFTGSGGGGGSPSVRPGVLG